MAATTTAAKPRIRIRNATEADLPAISRIHYDAFGPGVMMRLMHPPQGQPTDAALAAFEKSLRSALPEQRPTTTTTTTAAALSTTAGQKKRELPVEFVLMVAERLLPGQDGGEGEVIAFAKWKVVKEELTEEEWNVDVKDQTVEELGVGTDVDVYNAFISELVRTAKGLQKGEPLLYLNILACKTSHHRSGAGSALLRWGVDKADREGINAYLEASPTGYPLYRRFGFEDVHVQDLDVTARWGAVQAEGEDWGTHSAAALAGPAKEGVFRTAFMKRMPRQPL